MLSFWCLYGEIAAHHDKYELMVLATAKRKLARQQWDA